MDLCWQSNVSAFQIRSRLIITFLPRSKRLLISWLQSSSAVILETKKIKSATVSTVSPSLPPSDGTSHPKRNSKINLKSVHLSSPASLPLKLPSPLWTTMVTSRRVTRYYCHQIVCFVFLQCPSFKAVHSFPSALRRDHVTLFWQ